MSYNDPYGGGGGGRYNDNPNYENRPTEQSEYGGGGRGSDNYYNQGGGGGGYNEEAQDQRRYGHGGGGGGESGGGIDSEFSGALTHAQQQHESPSGEDSSIFSSALSFLSGNKHAVANEDLDERQAVGAHQAVYGGGGGGGGGEQHSSETLGAGAALQALKMFTGGGGAGGQQANPSGQNQFIGMAMGQASKLFDQQSRQGNVVGYDFPLPPFPISTTNHRTRKNFALTSHGVGPIRVETERGESGGENGVENVFEVAGRGGRVGGVCD